MFAHAAPDGEIVKWQQYEERQCQYKIQYDQWKEQHDRAMANLEASVKVFDDLKAAGKQAAEFVLFPAPKGKG